MANITTLVLKNWHFSVLNFIFLWHLFSITWDGQDKSLFQVKSFSVFLT